MKRLLLCVVIIICVTFTGCQKVEREEKTTVTATVTEVQYRSAYVTPRVIYTGKSTITTTQVHPSRHLVTITYEDLSETFNNSDLYEKVEEGQSIQMILYKGYDKDDKLIEEKLMLPE